MAKLTPDEIKWILSIDAKGANKEIAVTSAEINRLSQANKIMSQDMKAAEKQIKETEKAMEKLTKAGQQESDAYQELKDTRDMARYDIDDYTRKIGENNRAIIDNKNKIKELTDGMSLNEMSMKQLRARAAELEKQLNVTSASANPEEYKGLQKELEKVNTRIFDVQNQGKGLIQQFAAMNNPVGKAAQAVQGFGQALKALIANPVGIVIMAVAAAFMALKKAISSSEENMNKFQQLLAPLKVLFDALLLVIQKTAGAILDFALKAADAFAKFAEKIPFIGGKMKELNDKAREGVELEKEKQALVTRERESLINNAEKERSIAELRNKAKQRDKYSNKEIIGFLDQAIELEKEITEDKIEQAKISLRILESEAARTEKTEEVNRKIAEQTALLAQLETDYYNSTRRMESERATRIEEMQREDKAKAKEALEKKLKAVDYALKEETKLLSQQLADRSITQEQYDRELEQKMLKSLQRKLEIAGLEKDQRIDIEQQILDFKIKAIELEKQIEKEKQEIKKEYEKAVMTDSERELQDIRDKHDKKIEELKQQLQKERITETEFNEYKAIELETQEKELEEKRRIQNEALAAKKLAEQNKGLEAEKMILMDQYASGLISKKAYSDALLELDRQYALQSIEISNLSDAEKIAARKKLLDIMVKQQDEETKKQEDAQKKRVELYSQFSEQIGTMLAGVISGNEDLVKSSLKTIINMALDALEAQITMAIASATAQSFAQPDSVATFGASGATRAAILTALIKGAFAGVKAIVNSTLSGSKKSQPESTTTTSTGRVVVTGRQSGGYFDVEREQDKRRYIAKFDPMRRGFISRPTVLVGDGPAGKSTEWVAGNDALQNPTIVPFIRLLDEAQQAGNIRTIDLNHLMRARMAGFQSGGFIAESPAPKQYPSVPGSDYAVHNPQPGIELFSDIKDLLQYLKDYGVKAPIVLSDLQRKQELLKKSQNIGTRQ